MMTRGSPRSRAQIWRGLVMKAENAVPFVPAMSVCEVVERREDQLVREIVLRGERLTERVTFYPYTEISTPL